MTKLKMSKPCWLDFPLKGGHPAYLKVLEYASWQQMPLSEHLEHFSLRVAAGEDVAENSIWRNVTIPIFDRLTAPFKEVVKNNPGNED